MHGLYRRDQGDERMKTKVWKDGLGVWNWRCRSEAHGTVGGVSVHWEIAQHQADAHARQWHRRRHLSHDTPTPPGGTHYDWSDTGMHLRIRE